MHWRKLASFAGAIALVTAGCTTEETTTTAPSPVASPAPAPAEKPAAAPFAKPTVPQKPGAAGAPKVAGLLQSTNANERAKQVQTGITQRQNQTARDPFADVPLTIPVPPAPANPNTAGGGGGGATGNQVVPGLPTAPSPVVGSPIPPALDIGNNPRASQPGSPLPPGRGTPTDRFRPPRPSGPLPRVNRPVASRPSSPNVPRPSGPLPSAGSPSGPSSPLPNNPNPGGETPIAKIPDAPSTTLANSVAVTGVAQIGNEMQAIVKAPNEPTSRYVRVGQRIANGQVLVKRIEMDGGAEPIVVLEENGVEVARPVGSTAPTQATS